MSTTNMHCWREKESGPVVSTVPPAPGKGLSGTDSKGAGRAEGKDCKVPPRPFKKKGTPVNENICMRHPREFSSSAGVFGLSNLAGKQVPATGRKTILHLLCHVFLREVSSAMCSDTLPLPEANLLLKLFTVSCEGEDEAC